MINSTLIFNSTTLTRKISALPDRIDGQVHAVVARQADSAAGWMKTNARWTDRTGNARGGLSSKVGWIPKKEHSITVFHRVSYGIFLEVRWAGRFAIILPTLQKYGPDTMRMLENLFSRLGGR